jgi:hypothetical protein
MTAVLMFVTMLAAGQESLASARDLYASAAYEDALAVLNRLPDANRPPDETRTIQQYRAFCLLALGRTAEAERSIEAVILGQPTFRPTDADMSPRLRAAFADVRRRVLPAIMRQKYAQAKAAFDRKDFALAGDGFADVLNMMTDPDAVAAAGQPPLSDLRTLAMGFRDHSATAAAPPPPLPAAPTPAPTLAAEPPQPPRIYTAADSRVVAPAPIRQDLPSYPGQILVPRQGQIEVVIDEKGLVETAIMKASVTPTYDTLALAASRMWRYRPATLNGVPVKYRKVIQISVKASGRS